MAMPSLIRSPRRYSTKRPLSLALMELLATRPGPQAGKSLVISHEGRGDSVYGRRSARGCRRQCESEYRGAPSPSRGRVGERGTWWEWRPRHDQASAGHQALHRPGGGAPTDGFSYRNGAGGFVPHSPLPSLREEHGKPAPRPSQDFRIATSPRTSRSSIAQCVTERNCP